MIRLFITIGIAAALSGCGLVNSSKPCTDQIAACGQRIVDCATTAGCDVSACLQSGQPLAAPRRH
jgi:hypothetical protein